MAGVLKGLYFVLHIHTSVSIKPLSSGMYMWDSAWSSRSPQGHSWLCSHWEGENGAQKYSVKSEASGSPVLTAHQLENNDRVKL